MDFLGFFPELLARSSLWDRLLILLDIILVYIIVYRLLLLIRGTRAVQVLTGVGIVSVAFILSERLRLNVVNYMLRQFFDYLFLILVIVFQDELRRALGKLGRNPFFGSRNAKLRGLHVVDEIAKAANILASKRTGALIVLERQHGLKDYTDGSTLLDAELSAELLISIFQPSSPIHDGAVVIRENKIIAAGCFFPLDFEGELDRNLGTRHRAAVAIAQETDALVVVLSEERGEISLVHTGQLKRDLSADQLKALLIKGFELSPEVVVAHG